MRIVNSTRGTVLADDAELAATFWRRFVGLMGRQALAPGTGLVIDPCRSVHTMFMRFPIDVAYVDGTSRVVKVVCNLRPFRTSAALLRSSKVIELPAGAIGRSETEPGDILAFQSA